MKKLITLSLTLISFIFLTGFSLFSTELPECKDKETISALTKIFNDAFKEDGLKYISSKNITEDGFNKEAQIRVCSADVMISDGSQARVTYNITWQNKDKKMFYVEIVGVEE